MRVDIRYLDTFLTVCESGGISKASFQLHLTQPAVSYRVKMLERQLKLKLFEPRGRSLVLTPAGQRLKNLSQRYLEDLSAVHTEMIQDADAGRETIKIEAVSGYGRYVLFPVLCEPEFSRYRIHLAYPTAIDIFKEIEEGVYDLGFVYHKKTSHLLEFQTVYQEELVLVCRGELRKKLTDPQNLENYEAYPFITYDESDYVFGKWFDSVFGRIPRNTPSIHHFQELEEVMTMLGKGQGLTIVPDYVMRAKDWRKGLVVIRPMGKRCVNSVFAVTRAGASRPRLIGNLLERLKEPMNSAGLSPGKSRVSRIGVKTISKNDNLI